jgi:hypothetical protein
MRSRTYYCDDILLLMMVVESQQGQREAGDTERRVQRHVCNDQGPRLVDDQGGDSGRAGDPEEEGLRIACLSNSHH